MKNYYKVFLNCSLCLLLLTNCSQVSKKIARDNLSGTYVGTINLTIQQSLLNIGLEDKRVTNKCHVMVFASSEKPGLVVSIYEPTTGTYPPFNISMSNIQLRPNGSSFNIPEQPSNIPGTIDIITGVYGWTDVDGNKIDGLLSDNINLTFSYLGSIQLNIQGNNVSVPYVANYTLQKQSE